MTDLHDCPDLESWQALLDVTMEPEQQEGYRRHLETAYRMIWERQRAGSPPAGFGVPAIR